VCTIADAPGIHFLSPIDLSGTSIGISCSLQAHADLAELTYRDVKALLGALSFLLSLP
jgi:hypothetical protein